jgi:transcriptional regulator with XRE-family HTH domain
MTKYGLASKLGVSLGTLKNWERGRTEPAKQFWPAIRSLLANRTGPSRPEASSDAVPLTAPSNFVFDWNPGA